MAKNRLVNTKFWTDNYILDELNPIDKLVYLYLITNPHTDICGVYELPLKVMAVETGIDKENLEKVILPRFERDGKIRYRQGWVAVKNFIKHQTTNPKVQTGIEIGLNKAPEDLRAFMLSIEHDSLSIEPETQSHPNPNPNSNSNKQGATRGGYSSLGTEVIKALEGVDPKNKTYYGNTSQRKAADFLIEEYGLEEVLKRVSVLPRTNRLPHFPNITTPVQLRDKWVQLQDAVARKRGEVDRKKPTII